MRYKKKIFISIFVVALLIGIGYIVTNIEFTFSSCGVGYRGEVSYDKIMLAPSCTGYRSFLSALNRKVGIPLMSLSSVALLFLMVLLFLREQIFYSWLKFAVIFFPISMILIMSAPSHDGGMIFRSTQEVLTTLLPGIFFIVSFAIIFFHIYFLNKLNVKTGRSGKKTWWWRVSLLLISLILSFVYFSINTGELKSGSYLDMFALFIFFLVIISPFTFFINDMVFLGWVKFSLGWIAIAAVIFAFTPTVRNDYMHYSPVRDDVANWMSRLYLALSCLKIIWDTWQERKSSS